MYKNKRQKPNKALQLTEDPLCETFAAELGR